MTWLKFHIELASTPPRGFRLPILICRMATDGEDGEQQSHTITNLILIAGECTVPSRIIAATAESGTNQGRANSLKGTTCIHNH